MGQILGLKFRDFGQVYYFDSGPFVVKPGEHVIVNTDQGYGLGEVVLVRDTIPEEIPADEIKPIYRIAAEEDKEKQKENDELAREAFRFCRRCVLERELDMKLVDVEVFFDRGKIIFYFTAPNRIDFRELVKDLVRNYRTRIELRQIGVRHETQMIGAVGNCGQVCCCRRFLRKFAPVTIRMAKEQNLFLNPTKISGMCGRLLCCLSYEQSNYETFHKQCPKIGKKYLTREGPVKVVRANLFRNSLSVFTDAGEEKEYTLEEWEALEPTRPDRPQQGGGQPASPVEAERVLPSDDEQADNDSPDDQEDDMVDVDADNDGDAMPFYGKVVPRQGDSPAGNGDKGKPNGNQRNRRGRGKPNKPRTGGQGNEKSQEPKNSDSRAGDPKSGDPKTGDPRKNRKGRPRRKRKPKPKE